MTDSNAITLSGGSLAALDAAAADLQLLSGNLAKAYKVSNKATVLLSSFDDRLARLERTVRSGNQHRSAVSRATANANMTAMLKAVDLLLSHNDLVEQEESLIARGPNPANLDPYTESISRVVDALDQLKKTAGSGLGQMVRQNRKDEEAMTRRMQATIASGAKQLVQVVLTWLQEASPKGDTVSHISPTMMHKMTDVSHFIHAMPVGCLGGADKEFQASYADLRSRYLLHAVTLQSKDAIESARVGTAAGGHHLGQVLGVIIEGLKIEHAAIANLFPSQSHHTVYTMILPSVLQTFSESGQDIIAIIKRSFSITIDVAFVTYSALSAMTDDFDDWVREKGGPAPGALRRDNELSDIIQDLRTVCLRGLPEFIDDIRAWGSRTMSVSDGGNGLIADTTKRVISFTRQLCEHEPMTERFLQSIGEGNWTSTSLGNNLASPRLDGSEPVASPLLQKYISDVLSALLAALDTRAKVIRTRGVGSIFMLNNIAYLRREVLSSDIGDMLGDAVEDELNKRNRSAKSAYLEIFSGLISSLMDNAPESTSLIKQGLGAVTGDKRDTKTKDKFGRFADALAEVEGIHRAARLDRGEEDMRDRLRSEVDRMVIPTYSKFASRQVGPNLKTPRLDVATVQMRLNALFD